MSVESFVGVRIAAINDLKRHTSAILPVIQEAVSRVINSGWFVLGPEVRAFESEFADFCGTTHCISLANGTDALELGLRALGIGHGNTVVTVANAGMYSTIAILANGATPIYAEISPETLLVDVADLRRILDSQKIDAVIVTHLYGLLVDLPEIIHLAHSFGIPVIEDCAQAHGAMSHGQRAGAVGDVGCFSFYPTKNLGALGDGGAIVTNRPDIAEKVIQLRQYGWESKYHASIAGGCNSRLDEIQAAVLRVMLPMLDQWNRRRREIAARYTRGIVNPAIVTPAVHTEEYVAHLYVIRTVNRQGLKNHLEKAGIPSDIHYPIPDYVQSSCRNLFEGVNKIVTNRACAEVLTLPCFPEMSNDETDMVINCINSW